MLRCCISIQDLTMIRYSLMSKFNFSILSSNEFEYIAKCSTTTKSIKISLNKHRNTQLTFVQNVFFVLGFLDEITSKKHLLRRCPKIEEQ